MSFSALIITTETQGLYEAIRHFWEYLPLHWSILLVHGQKNKDEAKYIQTQFKIKTLEMMIDEIDEVQYSEFMLSLNLWNLIQEEHVLILNLYSALHINFARNIDQYIEYDYVGNLHLTRMYTNGLSLRKRSSMLQIIPLIVKKHPEEFMVCKYLTSLGKKICDFDKTFKFNVEHSYVQDPLSITLDKSLNPYQIYELSTYKTYAQLFDRCNVLPYWDNTRIINYFNPKTYLEIGLDEPRMNFLKIRSKDKESIDVNVVDKNNPPTYHMTSDEAFSIITKKYDLIFIDGLHECEQVLRDYENAQKHLNPKGIILFDDVNPPDKIMASKERKSMFWNGDVWKAIVELRTRPDISIVTVDTLYGLSILTQEKNQNILLVKPETFEEFEKNRKDYLNLISVTEFKMRFSPSINQDDNK